MTNRMKISSIIIFILIFFSMFSGVYADNPEGALVTSPTEEPHADSPIDGAHVTSPAEVVPVASHADGASVTSSTEWPRGILPSEGASVASPTHGVPLASLADALHVTSPTQESHVVSQAEGGHGIFPSEGARVISPAEGIRITSLRTKVDGILTEGFKIIEITSTPKQLETIQEESESSQSEIDSIKERQSELERRIFFTKNTDPKSKSYLRSEIVPTTEIVVEVVRDVLKPGVIRLEVSFAGHTRPVPNKTFFTIKI